MRPRAGTRSRAPSPERGLAAGMTRPLIDGGPLATARDGGRRRAGRRPDADRCRRCRRRAMRPSKKKRLHVRAGSSAWSVVGHRARGARRLAADRRRGAWRTLDRDRTRASGRYVLRDRMRRPQSAPARVRSLHRRAAQARAPERVPARVRVVVRPRPVRQPARLRRARCRPAGSASPTSRCRAAPKVTLRHGGRTVRVRVIDRGPYVGGPRVRPHRGDRPAAALPRPRARSSPRARRSGAGRTLARVPPKRVIAHLDCDAFYATVELLRRPELPASR